MQKRYRDLLRVVVTDLRHTLSGGPNSQRGDLDRELERLGVAPDGTIAPFDALPNPTPAERQARRAAEAMMNERVSGAANVRSVRSDIVERAAYTWINRLLALRAMEARGLIAELLRADPAYAGLSEALFVLRQTQPARAAGPDGGWWAVLEDACQAQAAALPGLFDLADPAAALRPSTPALLRCVTTIGTLPTGYTAEEADAAFADPDAIGWAYQFYQEEAKARTYAKLNSGGKAATRGEIAAVTQLFTEPYMVKWLLQNSLGRTYHELYPDSRLPETWEYCIRDLPRDDADPVTNLPIRSLTDLTFMDPCMGSGHFEREAFDMYFAMYREQYPDMRAAEIADRILTRHLHGIDLDPRAAQLAALTLYLRAWELVRDERRAQRLPGPGTYRPPAMNLATTPTGLTPGSLARHLQRHPEDRIYRPLLEGIFAALEQADVLGSLLRPGEQLDAAIRAFRTQGSRQLGLLTEDTDLNHLLDELARHDSAQLKRVLLERVARSFATEAADADDVAMALFGREASEGLRLLQLLDRQYAVVATNPPYMGSGNMDDGLRRYVEHHFNPGKRDLYAVFILRCLNTCYPYGRLAMVTQQSWMFLKSFADLRTVSEKQLGKGHQQMEPAGLLHETTIETLAHLGPNAFEEISGAVVQTALFVLAMRHPPTGHALCALRLVGAKESSEKMTLLRRAVLSEVSGIWFTPVQKQLCEIPTAPICYWLPDPLLRLLQSSNRLVTILTVKKGLDTADNNRFVRLFWEAWGPGQRWRLLPKGGGYGRWGGQNSYVVDWQSNGARIKSLGRGTPRNEQYYGSPGITYTEFGQGCLGVRALLPGAIFNTSSPGVFFSGSSKEGEAAGILNCRISSFFLRVFQPSVQHLGEGYVPLLPAPDVPVECIHLLVDAITALKQCLVNSCLDEPTFVGLERRNEIRAQSLDLEHDQMRIAAILHTLEGQLEFGVFSAYGLDCQSTQRVLDETGTPAGWYPLVPGHDTVPTLPIDLNVPPLPQQALVRVAEHKRIGPDTSGLSRIRSNLRTLYEAGPSAKVNNLDLEELDHHDAENDAAIGAYIPIPTETFLEELSQKLQIHPISVYWLLQELRAEGVRCRPEELRLLEDRLSVLVLRLLGHRWPRQLEAGEAVPSWADRDGIIPLTAIAGETSLAARVRDRLRAEDGDRGAQQVEALLLELTKQTLEEWLRRTFFARHVRQFKHRPIAWHLASTPAREAGRKTKTKRVPAFECLLYYHACRGDVLARLRAHYVAPLIRLEAAAAAEARRRSDETAAAIATARVHELEEFAARLRTVEELGFASAELDHLLAGEPLDRWSGDGVVPPASTEDLVAQERAWQVDLNDGVRVNVAPLQLAGLLISDVLRSDDARKAIADRARWRADERRWVRDGVLPRCGWMEDDVPESPRWTERAPERAAEQRKLEEKRRAVREKLGIL